MTMTQRKFATRDKAGHLSIAKSGVASHTAPAPAVDARSASRSGHVEKMEALGKFTVSVAHDINNILAIAQAHIDLIEFSDGNSLSKRHSIPVIKESLDRAVSLLDHLLLYGHKQQPEPIVQDLRSEVQSIVDLLPSMVGPAIDVVWDVQMNRACPVLMVGDRFAAAIMNLVSNAKDAMPRGGELAIVLRHKHPHEHTPGTNEVQGDWCVLEINDTGEGISPQSLHRVFEPFFTTKCANSGTGMGLSLVNDFVQQSGGHAIVDSELGLGTKFSLYFPIHQHCRDA